MAFRRRFNANRRRFSGGRRPRQRFEVAQVSRATAITVGDGDTSRSTPFVFFVPIISQFGLIRTGTAGATPLQTVMDTSVRGISVQSLTLNVDVIRAPDLDAAETTTFVVEYADCIYTDAMDSLAPDPSTALVELPNNVPRLFSSQVSSAIYSTASDDEGGFTQVFDWPLRIHYRRWGNLSVWQNVGNLSSSQMAVPISLAAQNPVTFAQRRIKIRSYLKDAMGLFYAASVVNHGPVPFAGTVFMNAVVVYRIVR